MLPLEKILKGSMFWVSTMPQVFTTIGIRNVQTEKSLDEKQPLGSSPSWLFFTPRVLN
ncbi:MAG: hypothetical protein KZY87_18210 [Lachnospiraceae bacterium]|uniref:hypothetical protein n=1 Tax=Clostridium sp. WB02_MRS01 TaxID=2605777 RepID=UPI0012B394DC|nr:hypothetical protein [Clostridium sp. WB02_MRS01]MBW4847502.1 hypothetical protein [Lachnospiraceae bacterium]